MIVTDVFARHPGLASTVHAHSMTSPSVHFLLFTCICMLILCVRSAPRKDTVICDIYELAAMADGQGQAQGKGALTIQSATAASQAPSCSTDAECLALCPSRTITQAQPKLTATAVEQQVKLLVSASHLQGPLLYIRILYFRACT